MWGAGEMPDVRAMGCKTALLCCVMSPCYIEFPVRPFFFSAHNFYSLQWSSFAPCSTLFFCALQDCISCQVMCNCLIFEDMVHCGILEQSCRQRCCKEITFIKGSVQCCCDVVAWAIPCDKDVPLMLGVCGIMCKDAPPVKKEAVRRRFAVM